MFFQSPPQFRFKFTSREKYESNIYAKIDPASWSTLRFLLSELDALSARSGTREIIFEFEDTKPAVTESVQVIFRIHR